MGRATTHRDVLVAARRLQAAALADDDAALHAELRRLRNTFIDHARDERRELSARHGGGAARLLIVEAGHRHLLERIDDLLATASGDREDCRCHRRAVELTRDLSRHALAEVEMFARP